MRDEVIGRIDAGLWFVLYALIPPALVWLVWLIVILVRDALGF